jgi:hypothetical protein
MAEYKHQEQDLRVGLQHLAHLKQEASATPAVLIHQHQHLAQHRLVVSEITYLLDSEQHRH